MILWDFGKCLRANQCCPVSGGAREREDKRRAQEEPAGGHGQVQLIGWWAGGWRQAPFGLQEPPRPAPTRLHHGLSLLVPVAPTTGPSPIPGSPSSHCARTGPSPSVAVMSQLPRHPSNASLGSRRVGLVSVCSLGERVPVN